MSRHARSTFQEPSLVPLADMLCNTVGIIVFILIFTVLTAGGAVLMKRLPYERTTTAKRVIFVCYHDRVLPLDDDGLQKRFANDIPHDSITMDNLNSFVDSVNNHEVDDDYFTLTVHAEVYSTYEGVSLNLVSSFQPKDQTGELSEDFGNPNSIYPRALHAKDPKKAYILFLVYPDSLDVFDKARNFARLMHYETGWSGSEAGQPLKFSSNGANTGIQ